MPPEISVRTFDDRSRWVRDAWFHHMSSSLGFLFRSGFIFASSSFKFHTFSGTAKHRGENVWAKIKLIAQLTLTNLWFEYIFALDILYVLTWFAELIEWRTQKELCKILCDFSFNALQFTRVWKTHEFLIKLISIYCLELNVSWFVILSQLSVHQDCALSTESNRFFAIQLTKFQVLWRKFKFSSF